MSQLAIATAYTERTLNDDPKVVFLYLPTPTVFVPKQQSNS